MNGAAISHETRCNLSSSTAILSSGSDRPVRLPNLPIEVYRSREQVLNPDVIMNSSGTHSWHRLKSNLRRQHARSGGRSLSECSDNVDPLLLRAVTSACVWQRHSSSSMATTLPRPLIQASCSISSTSPGRQGAPTTHASSSRSRPFLLSPWSCHRQATVYSS